MSEVRSPSAGKLFGPFAIDVVLAAALLFAATLALVTPVIVWHMFQMAPADGSAPDVSAAMAAALPGITAASILAMLMVAVLVWLLRGRRLVDPVAPMAAAPAYALAVVAGVAIQGIGFSLAWLSEYMEMPVDPSNIEPVMAIVREWPVFAWIAVVVIAPLSEELLFRHVLLRRFAVAGRGALGIAVTALLFAALHEFVPGEAGIVAWLMTLSLYLLMGIGFGFVYVRTRRFGAAFAAHASCNLLAMILLSFSPS